MAASCAQCRGTGFVVVDGNEGPARVRPCGCRDPLRGGEAWKSSRIPRRYEHCTLEKFERHPEVKHAVERVERWADCWPDVQGEGLLLQGPPGTGKTHLAVAIARLLMEKKGAQVLFYEQRELLRELQGTFETGASTRGSDILQPVWRAELLILDDLGAGRMTPWVTDVLHEIIVQRYNQVQPLIVTTNRQLDKARGKRGEDLTASETLRERIGEALFSRLYEMCDVVKTTGAKDYRVGIKSQTRVFDRAERAGDAT